jgi:tRNA nucleotidyltransferase/poly(A) polymerase
MALINRPDLSRRILSDTINKWIFNNAKARVFLVGGHLRDILLGRRSMDMDYVVDGDPLEIAREASRVFMGTLIIFKGHVCRVVLPDRRIIDFTPLKGDIHNDLMQRDFTINAMAWTPEGGIIDPSGGIRDLERGIIRVLSSANLEDDPLRVLRAYRHAAELSFRIDRETSRLLEENASGLKQVSPERITYEFFRILNQEDCHRYLVRAFKDGVLQVIIRIDGDSLKENLRVLRRFESFMDRNHDRLGRLLRRRRLVGLLDEEISQGLERAGLIKLCLILKGHGLNKRTGLLRVARRIKKAIRDLSKALELSRGRITEERLYDIFSASGGHVYEASMVLSIRREERLEELLERADDFIRFKKRPLLNGEEIREILGGVRGVMIGRAQALLHRAQFMGQIRTKTMAKDLILSNFT